jgi:hypothetical protein
LVADISAAETIASTAVLPSPQGSWDTAGLTSTGAYRDITGSGIFAFSAEMTAGANNAWSLQRYDGERDAREQLDLDSAFVAADQRWRTCK